MVIYRAVDSVIHPNRTVNDPNILIQNRPTLLTACCDMWWPREFFRRGRFFKSSCLVQHARVHVSTSPNMSQESVKKKQ